MGTTSETWIRVTTFNLPVDQESAVAYVRSSVGDVTRLLRSQPGYAGGYWGDSPADRTYSAVLHWNGLKAIQDATEVLEAQLARRAAAGFPVLDVKNVQVSAMWREARQLAASEAGGPARSVERPLQLPASSLVPGHPHQARSREGSDEVHVDTVLRIHFSRLEESNPDRGLAYLRSTAADARALMQLQPGFKLGYAGRVPATGAMATITYWSNPQALKDAEPALASLESERLRFGIYTDTVRTLQLFALPAYVKPQMAEVV